MISPLSHYLIITNKNIAIMRINWNKVFMACFAFLAVVCFIAVCCGATWHLVTCFFAIAGAEVCGCADRDDKEYEKLNRK